MTDDGMSVRFHGSGLEVGRSAISVSVPGTRLLLDCGLKLVPEGEEHPLALDELAGELDAVLVSHAHLDHVGYLSDFVAAGYNNPIYMTVQTARLTRLLLEDSAKVREILGHHSPDPGPALDLIQHVRLDEEVRLPGGTTFSAHQAGHIPGATGLLVRGGGRSIFYTGDICQRKLHTVPPAELPKGPVDCLILESTYGGLSDTLPTIDNRDRAFMEIIGTALKRRGTVLVPAFAVGRSQEVMLTLHEHQKELLHHGNIRVVPCGGMLFAATKAYDKEAKRPIGLDTKNGPLSPIHIPKNRKVEKVASGEFPTIVVATAGMLTGGASPRYLQHLAGDSKNLILIVGYQAEGTPGRELLDGSRQIMIDGQHVDIKAEVGFVSFSSHTYHEQSLSLVQELSPGTVLCNHGEPLKCAELASAVEERLGIKASAPPNGTMIRVAAHPT
ncbi:MAG: MBL fold metallo-hydrolase [Methanopyri archaeon]|nr:MBL fold metallo-hydrolase [Methanopyri archaeon]